MELPIALVERMGTDGKDQMESELCHSVMFPEGDMRLTWIIRLPLSGQRVLTH